MKRMRYPLALTILMLALPLAAWAGETAWFDLENCSMCKPMMAEEGLMQAMHMETVLTADGFMSIVSVPPAFEEKFAHAAAGMEKVSARLMAGEKLPLCGSCQDLGALHQAGATIENFQTAAGHITLVSSTDPALIEKLHAHGQRNIDEFAKMMEGEHAHANPGHH